MIDTVDRQIIELLEQDARQSNREVARLIGVSESTVRSRLRKLQNAGAICFTLLTDPQSEGFNTRAFVRLLVAPGQVDSVMQNLVARDETTFVAATTGRYNVIAFVIAKDNVELREIASDDMAILNGVREIDVRTNIESFKYDPHLVRVMSDSSGTNVYE